jgi:putative SOS response-associated peptidase YedK
MCGRFVASRPISDIVDVFDIDDVDVPDDLTQPRWNIAPQAGVLAVTVRRPKPPADPGEGTDPGDSDHDRPLDADESSQAPPGGRGGGRRARAVGAPDGHAAAMSGRRRLTSYRWGLVPSWAKDPGFGARAFNARAESLLDKAAFRTAVARRRCLIPADAFYEWEKGAGGPGKPANGRGRPSRQPWCYRSPDGGPFAFAGLFEAWKARGEGPGRAEGTAPVVRVDPSSDDVDPAVTGWHDDWLLSCTIITTPANDTVSPVHDRMPLVLDRADWEAWLRPGPLEADELAFLLRTPPPRLLEAYEVSSEVNASSSEGPQLVEPLSTARGPETSVAEPKLF